MAQNNLLEKTKLSGAMQEITSQELQKKAEQAYKTLLFENDLSDKMQAKHLKQAILPAVAVYTTLLEDNWLKEDAFELIRKSVLDAAKPMAKAFQSMGRLPFFFLVLRKMCPASIRSQFGSAGWKMEWKRNDQSAIEWDCHSCFYADVLNRHGMMELLSIFCESDDVVYRNIPDVLWGRTKTIGCGAELCDFRFYNCRRKRRER